MNTSRCKSCGALMLWIKTTGGKSMPCDAKPVYYRYDMHGKKRIVTPNGQVLPCEYTQDKKGSTGTGYIPHWSTCPQANAHRKRAAQVSLFDEKGEKP